MTRLRKVGRRGRKSPRTQGCCRGQGRASLRAILCQAGLGHFLPAGRPLSCALAEAPGLGKLKQQHLLSAVMPGRAHRKLDASVLDQGRMAEELPLLKWALASCSQHTPGGHQPRSGSTLRCHLVCLSDPHPPPHPAWGGGPLQS